MLGLVASGLTLVAGACGDPDPDLEAAKAEYPTGGDAVVVRVSSGGGFVPLDLSLGHLPEFTLYGDGQLIWLDYEGGSSPTAALPALRTTVLNGEQIQALLDRAAQAGILDGDIDYGTPNITDVGGTTVTVNVDGVQHSTSAYALGFDDVTLTDQQHAARDRLEGFIDDVSAAATQSAVPYAADAVAVFVFDYVPNDGGDTADPPAIDWPFADLATIPGSGTTSTPCFTLTGDEVVPAVELAADATVNTPWVASGEQYHLVFRPLLPDESGCDDLN